MTLTNSQTTLSDDDIREITESVWSAILGIQVEPCPVWAAEGPDLLTAVVDIGGAWHGSVRLQCGLPLARQIAGVMFGVDPDTATLAQMKDALAEITNMTSGNLKALLPEPSTLSLPVAGRSSEVRAPEGRTVSESAFVGLSEPVLLTIYERPIMVTSPSAQQ
jgi:chemotaxis protein CheX